MNIKKHNPNVIPLTKSGNISLRSFLLKIKKHYDYPTIVNAYYDVDRWYIIGIGNVPTELIEWYAEIPGELR